MNGIRIIDLIRLRKQNIKESLMDVNAYMAELGQAARNAADCRRLRSLRLNGNVSLARRCVAAARVAGK